MELKFKGAQVIEEGRGGKGTVADADPLAFPPHELTDYLETDKQRHTYYVKRGFIKYRRIYSVDFKIGKNSNSEFPQGISVITKYRMVWVSTSFVCYSFLRRTNL